ncbi:MAG TPA: saccharopine dehydrogenase C-terminal domain-containing protein [Solirubrobacteraceae bacterium]|jgi:saccharopine dehydrogenase-like NADP-dependent oxidoreductase|nr:saccharopine dehydrogenase C-terminal domain-containing protein [Solirubrobacteraceae bacterium]
MRVLVVGAGGVGAAFAAIAQRRPAFEHVALADVSPTRAHDVVAGLGEADRFSAERVDASDRQALVKLIERVRPDAVLNACDPRFNEPIFDACFDARVTYLDMAMTLSHPHPQRPHELPGVMLGDVQLARSEQWSEAGLLALVGMGVEPGLSDVFARYAAEELFSEIREVGVRDGADLVVDGYDFAPTFSIWTTIEECLNPPLIWERERGFYTTPPFSEPEVFEFPEGIGPVECVNVEHEEVVLIPRWVDCERVTFKYGLGQEFIDVLKTLHKLGLDSTEPVSVRAAGVTPHGGGQAGTSGGADGRARVSPRDVVAATLPDPAKLGERMTGRTCAGTWAQGTGKDGQPRSTYLYHLVDNEQTMREYGSQAVVWQTAINPVVALELLDAGVWKGVGVLGPEAFPPTPFLERLAELGAPHGQVELPPAG